ncbi:hypothetical protein RA279_29815, partial [Pseudomonas syringae pv. tagetis]
RQYDVQQNLVGFTLALHIDTSLAVLGQPFGEPVTTQVSLENAGAVGIVVDGQNALSGHNNAS